MYITEHSPEQTIKRLASARRRDAPDSPKSPKRSPKKGEVDVSEEESESDSQSIYEQNICLLINN